jgi:hypothetical protein
MTIWRTLQLLGLIFLVMGALTHVAERFHIFPSIGWGQPASVGHYLDLVSVILGCTLLPLGIAGRAMVRRKNSN